jgi:hypothetical protein
VRLWLARCVTGAFTTCDALVLCRTGAVLCRCTVGVWDGVFGVDPLPSSSR